MTVSNEKRFESAYSVQLYVNFTSCPCEQSTYYTLCLSLNIYPVLFVLYQHALISNSGLGF